MVFHSPPPASKMSQGWPYSADIISMLISMEATFLCKSRRRASLLVARYVQVSKFAFFKGTSRMG